MRHLLREIGIITAAESKSPPPPPPPCKPDRFKILEQRIAALEVALNKLQGANS
jgi:hypothetical protein